MSQSLGADELRIRSILRKRGVGPDAEPPPMPAGPPPPGYEPRQPDWLDDILDGNTGPAAPAEEVVSAAEIEPEMPQAAKKAKAKSKKKRSKKQKASHPAWDASPRQSLLDAWDRIPPRLKWLGYHATAAAAGWRLGWVGWSTNTAAWYTAGHWTAPTAFVLYGLAICAYALYRPTRSALWPIAWICTVPVSSIVVGVLLYAPTR